MAITLDVASIFPEGTSLEAHTALSQVSSGGPLGSPVATGTVSAGEVTFDGLTEDEQYIAFGLVGGEWRRCGFSADTVAEISTDDVAAAGADGGNIGTSGSTTAPAGGAVGTIGTAGSTNAANRPQLGSGGGGGGASSAANAGDGGVGGKFGGGGGGGGASLNSIGNSGKGGDGGNGVVVVIAR